MSGQWPLTMQTETPHIFGQAKCVLEFHTVYWLQFTDFSLFTSVLSIFPGSRNFSPFSTISHDFPPSSPWAAILSTKCFSCLASGRSSKQHQHQQTANSNWAHQRVNCCPLRTPAAWLLHRLPLTDTASLRQLTCLRGHTAGNSRS